MRALLLAACLLLTSGCVDDGASVSDVEVPVAAPAPEPVTIEEEADLLMGYGSSWEVPVGPGATGSILFRIDHLGGPRMSGGYCFTYEFEAEGEVSEGEQCPSGVGASVIPDASVMLFEEAPREGLYRFSFRAQPMPATFVADVHVGYAAGA